MGIRREYSKECYYFKVIDATNVKYLTAQQIVEQVLARVGDMPL
ncbi:hypothetical protein [Shewanella livingstonensis]|nr:hypothetical protein [Shewanella livingstonensis]